MKQDKYNSIIRQFYSEETFVDRFETDSSQAVDVIIPVIHTNELWEKNLISLYREVPVNRLLVSDGGCVDDSIDVAKKFPRVQIYDHQKIKSLGFCIRKLIEEVETEWFIYPHSDVYFPSNWFDTMASHKKDYDWFGCPMRHVIMVEYPLINNIRPYAGSQMGKKSAFMDNLHKIDDDYVYRQEDFVFEKIVSDGGGKNGKIEDTFHYHQTMYKPSRWGREVKDVELKVDMTPEETLRTSETQIRGIIKYLHPEKGLIKTMQAHLAKLISSGDLSMKDFKVWVKQTNREWLPYLKTSRMKLLLLSEKKIFRNIVQRLKNIS